MTSSDVRPLTPPRYLPLGYGVDDITLGFDMEGSGSVARLNALPGSETRRGKLLGQQASWGKWSHLLGRSVAFWKRDTKRLYVQAKLADTGKLCPPSELADRVGGLVERMAVVGITSYEEPWVTRLDVAVDASCSPSDGKLLLDALEAARLPNGRAARACRDRRCTSGRGLARRSTRGPTAAT